MHSMESGSQSVSSVDETILQNIYFMTFSFLLRFSVELNLFILSINLFNLTSIQRHEG